MPSHEAHRWLRMKRDRVRLALRRSSGVVSAPADQEGPFSYDHDAVDLADLAELLSLACGPEAPGSSPSIESSGPSGCGRDPDATPSPIPQEVDVPRPGVIDQGVEVAVVGEVDSDIDDIDFACLGEEPPDGSDRPHITLWFESPADVFDESSAHGDDEGAEITGVARAKQLAIRFLKGTGELTPLNVARIVEIILARKWSRAQLIVKDLLNSGFELGHIHQAFLISEAWRQCDELDERLGAEIGGRWS